MNEDKETFIVNQIPSWHDNVCLKCNKYLSIDIYLRIFKKIFISKFKNLKNIGIFKGKIPIRS